MPYLMILQYQVYIDSEHLQRISFSVKEIRVYTKQYQLKFETGNARNEKIFNI